jgi:hypothetical protein
MQIREALPGDEKAIFDLIYALAVYEKAPEQVTNTPNQLRKDLFEDKTISQRKLETLDRIYEYKRFD